VNIERVEVFGYDLTYVYGRFAMSSDRQIETLPSTVVRITTTDGLEGFGEVCPLGSTYLPAHAAGARAALRELAPAILGVDASNLGAIEAAMDRALLGHGYAKSAIDIACWDVFGKATMVPICQLLGGRRSDELPLYAAVPLAPAAEMTSYVEARRAEGFRRFQLKVGDDPHDDVARVRGVVDATGQDELVVADANGGWSMQDALRAVRALGELERVFVEQPCRTLEECLVVRAHTTLPMILDECIDSLQSLFRAHRDRAMEAFNLKISKVGGLTHARLMRDVAVALGLRVTIEDTWGGDLITAAVSHLAASTPPEQLFTVSFMSDWTKEHIAGYGPRPRLSVGSAPTDPGLGVEVDIELLGAPLFAVG
jgi:L-alanine-DL-glutamate epimerase-like enolase superfamily enzyme